MGNCSEVYDVIVIGAGPAGLSAGLYAGRARLSTLIVEMMWPGGQVANTHNVDNYPGFPEGISGADLAYRMKDQAEKFEAKFVTAEVRGLDLQDDIKQVMTSEGKFLARAVIVASGAAPRKLGVPGEKEFTGRGVSYCATCDGAFYQGKRVAVVGGGDSAIQEAILLTRFATEVTVIHRRDQLRATKVVQERAFKNPAIKYVWNTVVQEVKGDGQVKSLVLRNVATGEVSELPVDGVFVYVGNDPNTGFLRGIQGIELDEAGYIITNENMETSIPGVYAAGDVRKKLLRQVVTAVSDGAVAAVAAERYVSEKFSG